MEKGYTGRKLVEYTWIPKSKTYLREYREFLKICYDVEKRDGFFNDRTVGEEMVKRRAIVDRDNTADSYMEKYETKTIGDQSYVSNARMMIRICRWLGWMTIGEGRGQFNLTYYGINLTNFTGGFPNKIGDLNEYDLILKAFSKLKYYSVNDSPQYRNKKFKQRIFFNMIRVLSEFKHCSHYELVVSAFVLKDERDKDEYEMLLNRIRRLKEHRITIGEALAELNLDCQNKSSVTGVYDGPKVLLSFARQLGLVENIPVNKIDGPELHEEYVKMYQNSGHIKPNGIKFVSQITDKGIEFVNQYLDKKLIWFDELDDKLNESALLIYLNKTKKSIKLNQLNGFEDAIKNLESKEYIITKNDEVSININTDFDLYQDIPFESRPYVIPIIKKWDDNFLDNYDEVVDKMEMMEKFVNIEKLKKDECIYCANPTCKLYTEYSGQYGASDRFADRVCPMNIIKRGNQGEISIDINQCIDCMLCLPRCPLSAIKYNNKIIYSSENNFTKIKYSDKLKLTQKIIEDMGTTQSINLENIPEIIKSFEKKIKIPGSELKKDQIYVLVRNYFRSFGFKAAYSGSGGMKTRSDVTLLEPYLITSEVKSPAEGPINLKAVRQALDAAAQSNTKLTLAIGDTTHQGAIDQEKKYREQGFPVTICLMEIRYLLFLFLVRDKLNIVPENIKYLVENNPGYFDSECLKKFINYLGSKNKISNDIVKSLEKIIGKSI
jgi:ferredoxin